MPAPPLLPEQPEGDWDAWLVKGDRRTGKTTLGGHWLMAQALAGPERSMWAVCAPTRARVRTSLEAALEQFAPGAVESRDMTRLDVTLRNKARIKGFSYESPDSIRGYNLSGAWLDDADDMRYYSFWSDGLRPALRIKPARLVATAALEARWGLVRDLEDAARNGTGPVSLTIL